MDTLAVRLTIPSVGFVGDFHSPVRAPCRAHQKEGADLLGPFLIGYRLYLEVDAKTNLHLACCIDRTCDLAKVRRAAETQTAGIRRLPVIEDVRELHGERRPHAFRELQILGQRRICVPTM